MLVALALAGAAAAPQQHALVMQGSAEPSITCDADDPGKCTCEGKPIGPSTWSPPAYRTSSSTSIYNTSALMKGVETPLSAYRYKAALVVNVASA